ncbi:CBS domain-containing protein [Streptomyces sp. R302]|uniref:CBS domain-containing protein n=1 Tax=unclassified Streptomyces TaxID=2593676 RepID=UPI00145EC729|nr:MULTISPECIES: CBS domain-containing protein [unclassified Streptomyces]NML51588.1 CBS domain-containing protein [Streptomyces sp. R301]NML80166.1 CBS domain-containing protein [Streptomyces sp. R302]
MRARDLVWPCTPIPLDACLEEVVELLVRERSPALVVVSADGHPLAAVQPTTILSAALPRPVRDDPLLAAVGDRAFDETVRARAAALLLVDILPARSPVPPVVSPDASPLHMAAVMERTGSQLVVVVDYEDDRPHLLGTVDATTLLQHYF